MFLALAQKLDNFGARVRNLLERCSPEPTGNVWKQDIGSKSEKTVLSYRFYDLFTDLLLTFYGQSAEQSRNNNGHIIGKSRKNMFKHVDDCSKRLKLLKNC